MVSVKLTDSNLVTGRVGELVDYANEPTFEVVQKIFGYGGPYRRALNKFGIGNLNDRREYLKLIDGRIYSDIEIENEVLWKPCSYKLRLVDGSVINKPHLYGVASLAGFLKKSVIDIIHLAFIDRFLKETDRIYKNFSEEVSRVFENKTLSMDKFLTLYESVVFVSYLYELVFNYNNHDGYTNKSDGLKKYVSECDYMLSSEHDYAEFIYKLPQNFVFGTADGFVEKNHIHVKFVPDTVPNYAGNETKMIKAEAKLQCIKNNMRLKTNVLLYFLNQTVTMEA